MPETHLTPDETAAWLAARRAGERYTPAALRPPPSGAGDAAAVDPYDGDSATPLALGVPVVVGGLHLRFDAAAISRLDVIASPLLFGPEDPAAEQELSETDIAAAVYVLANGPECLAPVFGYRRRVAALHGRRPGDAAPEAAWKGWYLAQSELDQVWRDFESDAYVWYRAHCPGVDLQRVALDIMRALSDSFSWAAALGEDVAPASAAPPQEVAGVASPRKGYCASMWNGSAASLRRWWGWACRRIGCSRARSPLSVGPSPADAPD